MSTKCSICHKEIPSAADYCAFCGNAMSVVAKNKQKNDRSKKIRELSENNKLKDEWQKEKKEWQKEKKELQETNNKLNTDIDFLKNQFKEEKSKETKINLLMPQWVYLVYTIISIVFLILLCTLKN